MTFSKAGTYDYICAIHVDLGMEGNVTVVPSEKAAAPPLPAPPASRELKALVGSGRDTEVIQAFLPSSLTVRTGDTVTWMLDGDEVHTVSFLSEAPVSPFAIPIPGGGPTDLMINPQHAFPTRPSGGPVETYSGTGFISSGTLSDVPAGPPGTPANNNISVKFDTPGIYQFICLIHPFMLGTVEVVDSTVEDVPSQADIDAAGQKELAPLLVELKQIQQVSPAFVTSEAGPNGTTIWHVQAGTRGLSRFTEYFEFLQDNVTIQEGDTVVWTSPAFHTVTFHPGREAPAFVMPEPQEQGPPILRLNPEAVFPAKPAAEFDGTGYWNSDLIGLDSGGSTSFSMTFSKSGTFEYICAIHVDLGMEGSVTVVERQAPHVALLNSNGGEFPEGMAVNDDGNVFAGMAPTGEIKMITPAGEVTSYAKLPQPGTGFMTGMDFDAAGDLFVAMSSFDPETHGVWKVSDGGNAVELFASLPVEGFPNGAIFNSNGDLFVTDTIGGGVWKIDPSGTVTTWIMDPSMLGNDPPGPLGFPIGANGWTFDADENNLFVTVLDKSRIVQISVNTDGSAGEVAVFVEDQNRLGGPDGLIISESGNLYVALFGSDALAVVSPSGEISTLLSGGSLQNPSDVKFGVGSDSNSLYIANFAVARLLGLAPGAPQPMVLRMQITTP